MTYKKTSTYTVDEKEFEKAYTEVKNLLLRMFGTDYEGCSNVEFILVDRQRYETMHFDPVPYDFRNPDGTETKNEAENMKAIELAMRVAHFNLTVASSKFETLFRIWEHHRRDQNKEKLK